MLTNILALAGLLAVGFPLRALGRKMAIPPAASLMLLGVMAGNSGFALLPESYHAISPQLAVAAFVILLLRAGLGMEPKAMKAMILGIVAIGLIPAIVEMSVLAVGTRIFLFDRWDLAFLAAFLLAAVSPAVILPTMLDQKAKGRGGPRLVPDRIMGLAVVNSFMAKAAIGILLVVVAGGVGSESVGHDLLVLPIKLIGGILVGFVLGRLLVKLFPEMKNEAIGVWLGAAIVLLVAMLMYFRATSLMIEGVFAVLAFGIGIRIYRPKLADGFRDRFNGLWAVAEIPLFVNVGALIDLSRLDDAKLIFGVLLLMMVALSIRKWTAWMTLKTSDLNRSERIYVTLAQVPKATIQAVFGPIVFTTLSQSSPELAEAGHVMLIMAVLAIVATAPIGAVVLDRWAGRLLEQNDTQVGKTPL
ncbi:MAG: NhaP-type Na+/H+ or K+/H+ antiporter [Planctomycetota bacterium]|jgi:NhaP-type Na+/H+ or K+/H+ antiporter